MDDEIERRLEERAERGRAAGAAAVWHASRTEADAPGPRRHRLVSAAAVVAVGALLAGAFAISADDDPERDSATPTARARAPQVVIAQNASSLVLFDDCTAVLDELKEQALERVGPYGLDGELGLYYFGGPVLLETGSVRALGPLDAQRPATESARGPTPSTSATNTQERGIDEPDLVETDGERLFDVHDGTLRVVDIASAAVTASIPLGLVDVTGAVLVDDDLVVFANEPLSTRSGEARVVVVDVSGEPAVRERLTIDGTLVDVRAVAGRVHLVTVSAPTLELTYATAGGGTNEDAATEANKERVRSSTLADWLPTRTVTNGDGDITAERAQLTDCSEIRHPKEFSGFEQTSLVTLDLDDLASSHSTSVQASSQHVYGSAGSLYAATSQQRDVAVTRADAGRPIPYEPRTDIHRFTLGETPTYAGSGRVEGYVGGQFGLSEHEGHLRVASSTFEGGQRSRVTVLRLGEGELVETGLVDGLGPNEEIHGVRFVGDLGYVVTFRQVDPLYVVDLRDPDAPKLAGELKIPGYSEYLHPVGEGLVLGVGVDGTDDGRLGGAAMSLFDVRDPAAPTRLDLEAFGDLSASAVADDHHAFTWMAGTSTAYLPVGLFGTGDRIEVVRVADGGLTLVGTIIPTSDGAPARATFDRVVVVADRTFSISPQGVQVSDTDSLEPVAWVPYR